MATSTQTSKLRFLERRIEPVKHLPGFQKHHRVPSSANGSDQAFVASLMMPALDQELQEIFSGLRRAYGLKRKEISVDGPYEGCGFVQTPFFKYVVRVHLSADQPSQVVTTRSVEDVVEPGRLMAGPFSEVFGDRFRILEIATTEPLDLESIIDAIEDAESDRVQIDYDKDLTWCKINLMDTNATVLIRENLIQIESIRDTPPRELLLSFILIQQQFIEHLRFDTTGFEI